MHLDDDDDDDTANWVMRRDSDRMELVLQLMIRNFLSTKNSNVSTHREVDNTFK